VCARCNSLKQDDEHNDTLDPGAVALADHLVIDSQGVVHGKTNAGIRHILLLGLNDKKPIARRQRVLNIVNKLFRQNPLEPVLLDLLGYPDNLPNLSLLRPPGGNSLPDGIAASAFELRRHGALPHVY
jgi:hypothetical protein